jgi:hypothetical protein
MIPEIREAFWTAPALWRFARRRIDREISAGAFVRKRQAAAAGRNAGFQPAFGQARANPPAPTHSCPSFIKSQQTVQSLKENPFAIALFDKRGAQCAYAKRALMKIPSLDDWEKELGKNSQRSVLPKLLSVDFRSPLATVAQSN